jgi:hypothetical protein
MDLDRVGSASFCGIRITIQGMPIILWIGINDEKDKPKWIGTAVYVSKNPYFCYFVEKHM